MLQHSKLHTPIDFEIALNRKFGLLDDLGSRNRRAETGFKWRCTVLDKIGGRGTSSDTIFELKRMGVYHGVKRRKKFSNQLKSRKCLKVDNLVDDLSNLNVYDGMECVPANNVKIVKKSPVKNVSQLLVKRW